MHCYRLMAVSQITSHFPKVKWIFLILIVICNSFKIHRYLSPESCLIGLGFRSKINLWHARFFIRRILQIEAIVAQWRWQEWQTKRKLYLHDFYYTALVESAALGSASQYDHGLEFDRKWSILCTLPQVFFILCYIKEHEPCIKI